MINNAPMNLKSDVLLRFMPPEDFKKFIDQYRSKLKTGGNRFGNYSSPITIKEKEMVRKFFDKNLDKEQLRKEYGFTNSWSLDNAVAKVLKKWYYQNMDKVKL